jgi:pyridoxine 5-phosphate synthase
VELHTGQYCENFNNIARREQELQKLQTAARLAHEAGLQVNAGHGLNYVNLPLLLQRVPFLEELNIGHSIISRAVFVGIETAVKEMLNLMAGYNPIKPEHSTLNRQ